MTDDRRTKIAAIQDGHYPWLYDRTIACTCGELFLEPDLFRQWGDHVADVLMRELLELSTPLYQCGVCRHSYHYCKCM